MSDNIRYEKIIEILDYELLGELPDPFLFNDGSRLTAPADWTRRRAEIYKDAIELQFGTMPPKPEFLEVEPLYFCGAGKLNSYRITTGTRKNPIIFTMYVFRSKAGEKAPAVISGDLCFAAMWEDDRAHTLVNENINFVLFNRTELAPDIANYNLNDLDEGTGEYDLGRKIYDSTIVRGECGGQVKRAYPEYSFGTIGAWAWGYSRCVDALEILGFADMNLIAFTGHSRGGKTAALAGALDERAAIVNPNATCSGGYSSYRINIKARIDDGSVKKSEDLQHIFRHFPAWMGQGMREYIGRENELPFDSHYLKAMVAPRVLFVSEAANDIMANPVGSYQTTEAAREVYKFLGCEDNLFWHFRKHGGHAHTAEEFSLLANIINHIRRGDAICDKFFVLPFEPIKPAYSWKRPEGK